VFLVLGALTLVVMGLYASMVFSLVNRFEEPRDNIEIALIEIALISVLVPKVYINLIVGMGFLVIAFRDWHGNVNRMLLLKLLDAQQSRDEGDAQKKLAPESRATP